MTLSCENCIHFTKTHKSLGMCNLHTIEVLNTKTKKMNYRKYRVIKHHLCMKNQIKI